MPAGPPLFPRLRSGHRLSQRPSPQKQIPAIIYTPRKDCDNGRIARYRIHASDDGKNWKPVTEGVWENSERPQTVRFDDAITARLFKLGSLQEVKNRNWTSVAEFDVIAQ